MSVITFTVLTHLNSSEYSVREYALLSLNTVLDNLDSANQQHVSLFKVCELQAISLLKTTHDEMTLKSILQF